MVACGIWPGRSQLSWCVAPIGTQTAVQVLANLAALNFQLQLPIGITIFRISRPSGQLSQLTFQFDAYREPLGTNALSDFADEWQVLTRYNLIEIVDTGIRLTERGMFLSDTVASVLSHRYPVACSSPLILATNISDK